MSSEARGIIADKEQPVLIYREGDDYPYTVTLPDGDVRSFEFETQAQAFRTGYRAFNPAFAKTGDPTQDFKTREYESRKTQLLQELVDDIASRDGDVARLVTVLTTKCENCGAIHEGRFAREYVSGYYETIEFGTDTEHTRPNADDSIPSDYDYTIGYDCGPCGVRVSDDVRDAILYLTDDELYVLQKARTLNRLHEKVEKLERLAEPKLTFTKVVYEMTPADVKPRMTCRWWNYPREGYDYGFVLNTTMDTSGVWEAKVASLLTGHVDTIALGSIEIGNITESIGTTHKLMRRVAGDYTIYREDGSDSGDGSVAFDSREAAILSITSQL